MSPTLARAWALSVAAAIAATLGILTIRPFIAGIDFAPDQGFNWYFWKRPDPDTWSRASAWGAYVAHQIFIWGVIAWAQAHRDDLRDRNRMHPLNWIALGGTAFFVALHYVQTAAFYDGLGQDLPVISSQGSVILLLVLVLILEAPRRGLFFGAGRGWFAAIRPILVRYHGYYFAWAITFTYWYHPMEVTGGHLLGFLYTFLLFLQAGFVFTRVHTNRWWTFLLEASVLIHGVVVALVAGQDFWTMFFFGFLALVVVTQMHGLGLGGAARWGIVALSVAALLWVYSGRGWGALAEIVRIPVIDYVLVFAIGGAILGIRRLTGRRSA